MAIFASRGRVPRVLSVLSGGAAVVLLLGAAASPSSAGGARARTPVVAGAGAATTSGGAWGQAKQVAAALNTGGFAGVQSVSCASAGNCAAGGMYSTSGAFFQAFVLDETNGAWGQAQEVAAALNTDHDAALFSVSCASAGNCSAGGFYTDSSGLSQAFVVTEAHGAWGKAQEVAGALNTGGWAHVDSVSCGSAGNCAAGGFYSVGSGFHGFVVTETHGTWGKPQQVAVALSTGGGSQVESVSCASAGNCSAGGTYSDRSSDSLAFVVTETHGTWGKAQQVAGALNAGPFGAHVNSVSCGSAGNCSAGGSYSGSSGPQAFVVNETNGAWGKAQQVAGALNTGGRARLYSVSCASAGNCSAGGFYTDSSANSQGFVVTERHGAWGKAQEVAAALNTGGDAQISSVSCASAGNCSAGGYLSAGPGSPALVVDEANGIWGKAQEVAGALSVRGGAGLSSVSCTVSGSCSAGGNYQDRSARTQAFVVSKP
jgi:D-alanine-D-alanine ligase-like ATP-grasp enzyme